jgi:hypothetical protein
MEQGERSLWIRDKRCGLVSLDREKIDLIERFIRGQCDAVERRQLAQILQLQPELIHEVAERVERAGEVAVHLPSTSSS